MEFVIISLLQFTKESSSEKEFENWLRFDRIMVTSLWPHFLAHPVESTTPTLLLI